MARSAASPWSSVRRAAAFILLTLAGCGSAPAGQAADHHKTQLFDQAYTDISRYYIEPMTPGALALAGLRNLASVDGTLSIDSTAKAVLLHVGRTTERYDAPEPDDSAGWAAVTGEVMATAREHSAALKALTPDRLDQTVLDGGLGLLDRFSHYAPPDQARERRALRDGFNGIGITLAADGTDARIAQIMPETPAAQVGLRIGDRILAVDGVQTATLTPEDVVERLRGPAGSNITLAISREGLTAPLIVSMRRAHIVPPTVTLVESRGIAHLRVTSFNQDTADSVAELLARAHREMGGRLRGIILDLRGNPGGLLDQSVETASLFLDGETVTSTIGRAPESFQYFVAPHRRVEQLPLAVLVNGGSASASEVVAAALQDSGRAVIVGSASYGKGTVQSVQRLPNNGELTVTWARLITPGGYILHKHGVVPTICTVGLPDTASGVAAALARSTGKSGVRLTESRAALNDAGWKALRGLCPEQRGDHALELRTAEQILANPALYARALKQAPAAEAHPLTTARVLR